MFWQRRKANKPINSSLLTAKQISNIWFMPARLERLPDHASCATTSQTADILNVSMAPQSSTASSLIRYAFTAPISVSTAIALASSGMGSLRNLYL